MRTSQSKILDFLQSRWGLVLIFIVLFYLITFLVYYFYSPGPEERRRAELQTSSIQIQTSQENSQN